MGFRRPNISEAVLVVRNCAGEACSAYNDGWIAMSCKKDLVELKWLIEDLLAECPTFVGEEEWEQQRLIELLKRK